MSFTVKTNRIPELIRTLRHTDNTGRAALKEQGVQSAYLVLAEMRNRTPVGRTEPNYTITRKYSGRTFTISHGRPSLRQHGMTLGSGWVDPQIEVTANGLTFKVISVAPHMQLILDGAPAHSIPRAGHAIQSFYWYNAPNRFKAAIYSRTSHPGFEGNRFAAISVEQTRPMVLSKFRQITAEVANELRNFFS